MKRGLPSPAEVKRPKFQGKRDNVDGFLTYVKSVKTMLEENAADGFDAIMIQALARQMVRQLDLETFLNLSCEQVCSRNIEFLLKCSCDELVKVFHDIRDEGKNNGAGDVAGDGGEEDELALKKTSLLKVWKVFISYLLNNQCVELSKNQYGSHTVECLLVCLKKILASCNDEETLNHFDKVMLTLLKESFTFQDRLFWIILFDVRATFGLRKLADTVGAFKSCNESVKYYIRFCDNVFDTDIERILDDAYMDSKAGPTIQQMLLAYINLLSSSNKQVARVKARLLKKSSHGKIDGEWLRNLILKSSVGNRMIEWLVSNKMLLDEDVKEIYNDFVISNLNEMVQSNGKYVLKALLLSYPPNNKQLIKNIIVTVNMDNSMLSQVSVVRSCIQISSEHKTISQTLIQRMQQSINHITNRRIDWAERSKLITDALEGQTKKKDEMDSKTKRGSKTKRDSKTKEGSDRCMPTLSDEDNFWYLLCTLKDDHLKNDHLKNDHLKDDHLKNDHFKSFNGLTIACEMVKYYKPKVVGPSLMYELELILSNDQNIQYLATSKKGAELLQLILQHYPDKLKSLVRDHVMNSLDTYCFNAYSSYLVKDVYQQLGSKKLQHKFITNIKPHENQIRLRNFALHQTLNLDKILHHSSTERFGS
ncbi:pumilio-family RNA-binding repeat protein [Gregarina niphandrodes]|uniref:Pumilio-family RNA-binding repeat protein n=1 Tax=Gregarina niphandrodes TaxID=110365 RepID=A0A023BCQ0_GRENI|nr:pumilio-family RNA-binding repeat protein [Gregarina niphandrodes]EZG85835.1 pumilio-family RNA-binding repeat protein [Gregarina niphandrodes]|eukprot:XP_011128812.1 pumilio-family RNA-binding repeat protein [Gregarina niphandrodes]